MFIPLHVKSHYSLGYGTASIPELTEELARQGYSAAALTDFENLYGQVEFHHQCKDLGIRPITGIEISTGPADRRNPARRPGRLVLLVRNAEGYGNLCRLVTRRHGSGHNRKNNEQTLEDLMQEFSAGLFILSDDPLVMDRIALIPHMDPDRLGLLVVRPNGNGAETDCRRFATERGIRAVADLDTVFLRRNDYRFHLLQRAVREARLVYDLYRHPDAGADERWLRSPREAVDLFADFPEAVAAASDIAEQCQLGLPNLGRKFAGGFAIQQDDDTAQLRRWCEQAISAKYPEAGAWTGAHAARLDEELAVFRELGFSRFMAIVAEIIRHCHDEGIPLVVRGSAVSSLVLHLLGGSPVDPLPLGLLFERFLHRGKSRWPDVDIDLPWHRRDHVIAWVGDRFGHDRVAMIAAHHTFRHRSALREGLQAFGASPSLIDRVVKALPPDDLRAEEVDFAGIAADMVPEESFAALTLDQAEQALLNRAHPLVRRLVGRPRHLATHPGGIVIGHSPLSEILPLERAPKGVVVSQYDHDSVAAMGLVKIDLLGNRCLSELEEVLSLAEYPMPLHLQSIPQEDPTTLDLIDRAETVGCFQLESPAMRALLAQLPVRRQADVLAALALIRPGAASGAVKSAFIRRARGVEDVCIPFPAVKERLDETHGLFLYEEDIMVLLHRTGNMPLAEADELRRGIVKSGGDTLLLDALQQRFLRPLKRKGDAIRLAEAQRAWKVAVRFAAYSFNKAHAASYAVLAYCSAYTKAHHPAAFACSLLNHHQGLYPLRTLAGEFIRIGVDLRRPHVNTSSCESRLEAAVGNQAVRIGLGKIRGLSRRTATAIVSDREARGNYISLRDLLERIGPNNREATGLVLSGACDGLAPLSPEEYPFPHEAVLEHLRQRLHPQMLDALPIPTPAAPDTDQVRLYRQLVRVRNELQYLGMYLLAHPMAILRPEATRYQCITVRQAVTAPSERIVRLGIIIAAMRRVPTHRGVVQFFTGEDETGLLEAVVLPHVYRRLGDRLTTPGPFLVEGRMRGRQEANHLEVTQLAPFHHRQGPYSS